MDADALIGTVLGTNCTLQKVIGHGEMGIVFLGQQTRPHRQVAVKVLQPGFPLLSRQYKIFLERFQREIDAVAALKHPNIIKMYECGEYRGLTYLVMPYIAGGTLKDEMGRHGPFPLEKAMSYLEQMGSALDFAHDSGVLHGNVQPANILVRQDGQLVLTDFGMVKLLYDGSIADSFLVRARMPLETFDYMAPEQVAGDEIDAKADLYSLGVVLYQMLTGSVPFQSSSEMQQQYKQSVALHTLRPDLPGAAEQAILKALASRPTNRYKRAGDFVEAFRQALSSSGVALKPTNFSSTTAIFLSSSTSLNTAEQMLSSLIIHPDNKGLDSAPSISYSANPVVKSNTKLGIMSSTRVSTVPSSKSNKNLPRTDVVKKTSFTLPSMSGFWTPSSTRAPVAPNPTSIAPDQKGNTPPPPLPVSWPSWGWPTNEKTDAIFMSQNTVADSAALTNGQEVSAGNAYSPLVRLIAGKRASTGGKRLFPFILIAILLILIISGVFAYTHINSPMSAIGLHTAVSGIYSTSEGVQKPKMNAGSQMISPASGAKSGGNSGSTGTDLGAGRRSFQVGAHPLLVIQGQGGDINMQVGSLDTVMVTARQQGNNNSTGVLYNQAPDGQGHDRISIATSSGNRNVDYNITVPSTTYMEVEIGMGSVAVAGISGVTIDTGSGSLNIQDVHGPVNVHTENGDIIASALTGSMAMRVGNGSIRVNDVNGSLQAVTHNGDVVVGGGTMLSATSTLQTNYGSVSFSGAIDPQGTYKLKTLSGNINITLPGNAAFQLEPSIGSGSVNNDFGGNTVGYFPRSQIVVSIGSGSVTVNKAVV